MPIDPLSLAIGAVVALIPLLAGLWSLQRRLTREQGEQALLHLAGIDAALQRGLAQALGAAAAEVQAIVAEDAGGSRQRAGEVAEGLVDKVCAHDNVPDDDDRAIATGVPSLEAPKIANCSTPLVKITRAGYGAENLEGN